jgi:ComEC/Rec2-related protein
VERAALASRPLAVALAAYAAGLATTWSIWSLLWVVAMAALLWDKKRLVGLVVLAVTVGVLFRPILPKDALFSPRETGVSGVVASVPMPDGDDQTFRLETAEGVVVVRAPRDTPVVWRSRVYVEGRLTPSRETDPAGAAPAGRMRADRVTLRAESPWPLPWLQHASGSFARRLDASMPEQPAALARALLLNQTADLDDETMMALRRSGTLHIVAASGAHVVLLGALLAPLIQFLPIPRGWRVALLMALLAVFAVAAGFRPPIVRATIMAGILLLPQFVRRVPDAITAWAVTAGVPLIVWPSLLHDLSFQLSVVATGALIFGVPPGLGSARPWNSWREAWESALAMIITTCVAFLVTLPLVAYHFGQVPIYGLLANLIVLPVLPILMAVIPFAGWVPGADFLVVSLGGFIAGTTQWVASLPSAVVEVPRFSSGWIGALWAAGFLAYPVKRREVEP